MDWTTPSFEEIKMDAEIGSYQADEDPRLPEFDDTPGVVTPAAA